ncbi:MAG TPA: DUF4905 domain-containing protein [Mucilaginibacter sp.]|nr:DUF4905 domain-containing protein [Mucilaginibacter sp.]
MEIDPISETIFAEIRDQSDKKVSFASVGLISGKAYFDDLQTEERWLTGIEAAYDGVLLLHNYQSESGPTHKGLIAVDGITGNLLWSNYTHAFDHLSANGPVIYDTRLQPPKLFLADIKTGAIKRQFEASIDIELDNDIELPCTVSADFLNTMRMPVTPFGNTLHYLEHNNLRIVSLHSLEAGVLQQRLYIMNDSQMVYEDLLNTDIQKLQPESFLMYKDHLIYLKNQTQLKVLNL